MYFSLCIRILQRNGFFSYRLLCATSSPAIVYRVFSSYPHSQVSLGMAILIEWEEWERGKFETLGHHWLRSIGSSIEVSWESLIKSCELWGRSFHRNYMDSLFCRYLQVPAARGVRELDCIFRLDYTFTLEKEAKWQKEIHVAFLKTRFGRWEQHEGGLILKRIKQSEYSFKITEKVPELKIIHQKHKDFIRFWNFHFPTYVLVICVGFFESLNKRC